jgi:Xaa-Pro aminopeptidase
MHENNRLDRLRSLFDDEIPALLVTAPANIRYLIARPTLFDPDFGGLLFVSAEDSWLFVDSRYTAQAEAADLACRVVEWSGNIWKVVSPVLREAKVKRAGFEPAYVTVAQWQQIKKGLTVELAPVPGLVEKLRLKKEPAEIDALAQAARLADEVFLKIVEQIKPGLAERELAADIDYWLRRAGAEASSFDTIVAGGPNSAFPHAGAGERRFQAGDLVKIDFGAVLGGYHSDMTRTVVLGRASAQQTELYADVAEAQARALAGLAPGVTGQEIDALARDYFGSIGKVDNFGHNLGHGVGLDVHEQPTLGPKSSTELEAGMVFTIEPGLYFPDFGGVRIEDMVVMCEHGIQILTSSTKELLEL